MRTKATLLGHPIHPTLVVIPLGALPTALVFDLLFVATRNPAWWLAAFVATLVGVVGIAAAMVPGFVDYLWSVPRRGAVWPLATVHMITGTALLVLYTGLALLRWVALDAPGEAAAWAALGLNAVGNLGLLAQGYLGGELRGRHQLGVETGHQELPAAAEARPGARETDAWGGTRSS